MEQTFNGLDKKAIADIYYASVPKKEAMKFLIDNYTMMEEVTMPRNGTNHDTYQFYKNPKSDDVRIIKNTSGCFASFSEIFSIESIVSYVEKLKNTMEKHPDFDFFKKDHDAHMHLVDKYNELVNPLIIDNPPTPPKLKM